MHFDLIMKKTKSFHNKDNEERFIGFAVWSWVLKLCLISLSEKKMESSFEQPVQLKTVSSILADDWFRYSEEAEEESRFGLCPLITQCYHTEGIYHQIPKGSISGGKLKPV